MGRVWVKICGITSLEAANWAFEAGADAIGFVFAPSRRRIAPEQAREIIGGLPPGLERIGVFVDEEPSRVNEIAAFCGLTMVQLHGSESPEYLKAIERPIIKAVHLASLGRPAEARDRGMNAIEGTETRYGPDAFPEAAAVLVEPRVEGQAGGSGKAWDWSRARELFPRRRLVLAGGLNPGNVAVAISEANPWGVDVSSGVEEDGQKNYGKIVDFVARARGSNEL